MPYDIAAGLMMLTGIIVSVFYCLDALHGERRDRSILFWKSLPVSDRTTVLAKASIPLLVVPLLTSAVAIGMYWVMLLLSSAVVLGSGQSVATLWTQVSFMQMSLLLLYHIFTAHTLWPGARISLRFCTTVSYSASRSRAWGASRSRIVAAGSPGLRGANASTD